MIASWARVAWELENDTRAYDTVITAAKSLLSRYSPVVGCIRSWDACVTKRYSFREPDKDFLVIVVSDLGLLTTTSFNQETKIGQLDEPRHALLGCCKTTGR